MMPAALELHTSPSALRSVGQLAPLPDLTRQCAFDLRSGSEVLSCARTDRPGVVVGRRFGGIRRSPLEA